MLQEKPTADIVFTDDYQKIINKQVHICKYRLCSSSNMLLDDIKQEAYVVFIRAYNKYVPSKIPFIVYFQIALKNHLGSFIARSYRHIDMSSTSMYSDSGNEYDLSIVDCVAGFFPIELSILEIFSQNEIEYVLFMLDTPAEIITELENNVGKKRKIARRELSFSRENERKIRKNIIKKLSYAV